MYLRLFTIGLSLFLRFNVAAQPQNNAPQHIDSTGVRYISYPNNSQNKDLYDNSLPYGLPAAIRSVCTDLKHFQEYKTGGISPADLRQLRQITGTDWCRIPGLVYNIGPWAANPFQNQYGEDSLTAAGDSYVYPARDTTWFISENYDELIVREIALYDSLGRFTEYAPDELLLLKSFPGLQKPIVTASFPYEYMHIFSLMLNEALSKSQSDSLIKVVEMYLATAEKQLGPYGRYTTIGEQDMYVERPLEFLSMSNWFEEDVKCGGEWTRNYRWLLMSLQNDPEVHLHIDSIIEIQENRFCGDAIQNIDPLTGRREYWKITCDTSFYIKSGFEATYCNTIFEYNRYTKTWIKHAQYLLMTKTLLPDELPIVAYKKLIHQQPTAENRSLEHFPPSDNDISADKSALFEQANNPLNGYLHPTPAQFNWEKDLQQHTCNWKLVSSPIR
jgi:hypothetical protein